MIVTAGVKRKTGGSSPFRWEEKGKTSILDRYGKKWVGKKCEQES